MAGVGHLRIDALPLQRPLHSEAVADVQDKTAGVQRQAGPGPEGGKLRPQGGYRRRHCPIRRRAPVLQRGPAQVQGRHHGIGGAGGAVDGARPAQVVQAVGPGGKQQGSLARGREGLVGGTDHQVCPLIGLQPQEGQVGPVGPVHHQPSTVGMDHLGNGRTIRQHTVICR